jgi:hypothetical protein
MKAALEKAEGKHETAPTPAAPAESSKVVSLATARQKRLRAAVVASLLAAAGAAAVIGGRGGSGPLVGAPAPPESEPTAPEPRPPAITDAGDAG